MIFSQVRSLIADILDIDLDLINLDTTQLDLEIWDSLATIQIMNSISDDFNIEVGLNDIAYFNSVSSIIDFIEKKA